MRRVRRFHRYDRDRVGCDHLGSARRERVRLVCFPPAGSGLDTFEPLRAALPGDFGSDVLHAPGHLRTAGSPLEEVAAMADCFVAALADRLSGSILFGHSLGAYVAYEVAARLLARKLDVRALVLSGSIPPSFGDPNFLPSTWEDDDLIVWFAEQGGIAVDQLREILPNVSEMVRADLRAFEGYRALSRPSLPLRALILVGREDPSCRVEHAAEWMRCFEHGELRVLPGAHHFVQSAAEGVAGELVAFSRTIAVGVPRTHGEAPEP